MLTDSCCQSADLSEATISVSSVANGGNVDNASGIIDSVDGAIIADPYSPKVLIALQLDDSRSSRILHQTFDALDNASSNGGWQPFKFLACRASKRNRIISHAPCRASNGA